MTISYVKKATALITLAIATSSVLAGPAMPLDKGNSVSQSESVSESTNLFPTSKVEVVRSTKERAYSPSDIHRTVSGHSYHSKGLGH